MSHTIKTGQLDLGGLKTYFSTNLSGSAENTTGFYPYTGNPAEFANSGYVDAISGAISGYIDSVSGLLNTRLIESGTNLSGYTSSLYAELKSDIDFVSGLAVDGTAGADGATLLSQQNADDISILSGEALFQTGQDLLLLITGASGDGVSGFVTGLVDEASGVLDQKIGNLNTNLRSHIQEDYLSKRDSTGGTAGVSGLVSFHKKVKFKRSVELERVDEHDEIQTYQSGVNLYSLVSGHTEEGAAHQVMTTFLRFPHSGDSANQNIIVGSFMYSGSIS